MDGSMEVARWRQCASHRTHGTLSALESSAQTSFVSVQLFLLGSLLWQTDRLTTLLGQQPAIVRIYARSTAMGQKWGGQLAESSGEVFLFIGGWIWEWELGRRCAPTQKKITCPPNFHPVMTTSVSHSRIARDRYTVINHTTTGKNYCRRTGVIHRCSQVYAPVLNAPAVKAHPPSSGVGIRGFMWLMWGNYAPFGTTSRRCSQQIT